MIKNAVGRDIPKSAIPEGREVFQGSHYMDGKTYTKQGPTVRAGIKPRHSKIVDNIREAIKLCELKDGMTVSFHHHFRDGDYVVNLVMQEVAAMGIKNITIAASSMGSAHDPIGQMIEDGVVTGLQTSGIRGKMGEAV
ncbi:MAG: hypothetical protein LBV04_07180, partial [Deferribacteraceae bacterium]|nr:hypothetical protein [Deferribacteraceae bacterium]